jgi:hypothetical protein
MSDEQLLTIEELAARLQFTAAWIREQVKLKRITPIRFNSRSWRFHWPSVLAELSRLK